MAKKTNAPLCDRCETPFRSATSFCPACGGPTPWASHDERVQYEVRQWRASRASADKDATPMMLVRTEAGYQPMAVASYNEYVWDQPLHPERDAKPEPGAVGVIERPAQPARTREGNGHAAPADAVEASPARPEPKDVEPAEIPAAQVRPAPAEEPAASEPAHESLFGSAGMRVTVSKKAIAIGVALVVGLPFGGKILGLASGGPKAPGVSGAPSPAALVAARSGFEQLSPDAVRFAVVVQNPNKSFEASGVTVNVVVHDARGRLIGSSTERVTKVPASGALGVAGAVGVSGPAAKMTVKVGTSSFQETAPAKAFTVRDVRMSRSKGEIVVTATVSGVKAVKGARVVAVHLDKAGKVVGGDFTYVDVPRAPGSVRAVVSTAGVRRAVARVEVYVVPR